MELEAESTEWVPMRGIGIPTSLEMACAAGIRNPPAFRTWCEEPECEPSELVAGYPPGGILPVLPVV